MERPSHLFLIAETAGPRHRLHVLICLAEQIARGIYAHLFQRVGGGQTHARCITTRKTAGTHPAFFGHIADADRAGQIAPQPIMQRGKLAFSILCLTGKIRAKLRLSRGSDHRRDKRSGQGKCRASSQVFTDNRKCHVDTRRNAS